MMEIDICIPFLCHPGETLRGNYDMTSPQTSDAQLGMEYRREGSNPRWTLARELHNSQL